MRRNACKSWVVVVQLVVLLGGCKSGDDDGDAVDEPTPDGPKAGQGSAGNNGRAGSGGSGAQAGRGNDGGATQAGDDASTRGGSGGGSGGGGAVGADSGSDPTPFPDTPLSKLPEAFAGAICDALSGCLGEAKLRELTRREGCKAAVEAELRAKDFAHMDGSISAGRVLYDPERLEECLEGIAALECDVLTHTFPEPCVAVLDGNVKLGEECVITADCEGAAFCASDSCPSNCTALLGVGKSCSGDDQCGDGLDCSGGKCIAPAAAGDECGADSGKACALGLNCKGATDTVVGSCVTNSVVQVGDEGDVCEPGGELCKDGLSCVFDGGNGFVCEKAVGAGAACHLGLPGQCPNDEYCDATEVTAASTCRELPSAGEECVLNGLCKGGLVCIADGGSNTCHAIADNGSECASDAACRSNHCESGRCEPPPACM
jgi:hypothetical protein